MNPLSLENKLLGDLDSLDIDEGICIESTGKDKRIFVNRNLMDIFVLLKIKKNQSITSNHRVCSRNDSVNQSYEINDVDKEFFYIDNAIESLKFIVGNIKDFRYYKY